MNKEYPLLPTTKTLKEKVKVMENRIKNIEIEIHETNKRLKAVE